MYIVHIRKANHVVCQDGDAYIIYKKKYSFIVSAAFDVCDLNFKMSQAL